MKLPQTRRAYLSALSRQLGLHCSPARAREILDTYTLRFSYGMEAGHSETELCQELGHPAALAIILHVNAENDETGWGWWHGALPRLLLTAIALALWVFWARVESSQYGQGFFLVRALLSPLVAAALCLVWRGYLKNTWGGAKRPARGLAACHITIVASLALFLSAFAYLSATLVFQILPPPKLPPETMGPFLGGLALACLFISAMATLYAVLRVIQSERRFLPVIAHGMGALSTLFSFYDMMMTLDKPESFIPNTIAAISPYIGGVLITLLCILVSHIWGKSHRTETALEKHPS